MWDARPIHTHFSEPAVQVGRYTGAGASVPTPVANVKGSAASKATLTRSGVGTMALTLLDVPLGVVQWYDVVVNSPANNKNVQVAPPAANTYVFNMQVAYHANGTAVDVAASEELCFEIWLARTQVP